MTNLDKHFWPNEAITKGELLRYYRQLAATILPYLRDRPLVMRVWPDGITGRHFYRWRLPPYAPSWIERYRYQPQSTSRPAEMAVINDAATLIWVVNQGVIELHPWLTTRQQPRQPRWLCFDLDPAAEMSFEQLLQVASRIGENLQALGLQSFPKTSGGDGLHIIVPLTPEYTFEQVRAWLEVFITLFERRHPGMITSDKRLAARGGRVLIDYAQNAVGKSLVAPYSVRARPGAPVSTPLSWAEVDGGQVRPADFTLRSLPDRLQRLGDLFADTLRCQQQLPNLAKEG
ncbi:non-homologous end-joining DNA ligase [Kallotenue papyrolyticum]|uniref:non-homologous end-joining DNA ligase n=1 Tax=Kallotenue papyrolyticum TaxID=1325125 RepID=UPI0013789F16|nr:non-homologous end-joining DNA ligase [Kallotenue papyrolyticum]